MKMVVKSLLVLAAFQLALIPALVNAQFPSDATVLLPDGTSKPVSSLKVGDSIATVGESGAVTHEPIYFFTHRCTGQPATKFTKIVVFLEPPPPLTPGRGGVASIPTPTDSPEPEPAAADPVAEPEIGSETDPETAPEAASDVVAPEEPEPAAEAVPEKIYATLEIAPHQFVVASAEIDADFASGSKELIWAEDVKPGYTLWVVKEGKLVAYKVESVASVTKEGAYKPYTLSGNLVVNGVVVSSHGDWVFDKMVPKEYLLAVYQGLLSPIRGLYHVLGAEKVEQAHVQVAQAKPSSTLGTVREFLSWKVRDHTEL